MHNTRSTNSLVVLQSHNTRSTNSLVVLQSHNTRSTNSLVVLQSHNTRSTNSLVVLQSHNTRSTNSLVVLQSHNTRSTNSLVVLQSRTNLKAMCLSIHGVKLLNYLTLTLKMSNNIHVFKKQLNKIFNIIVLEYQNCNKMNRWQMYVVFIYHLFRR